MKDIQSYCNTTTGLKNSSYFKFESNKSQNSFETPGQKRSSGSFHKKPCNQTYFNLQLKQKQNLSVERNKRSSHQMNSKLINRSRNEKTSQSFDAGKLHNPQDRLSNTQNAQIRQSFQKANNPLMMLIEQNHMRQNDNSSQLMNENSSLKKEVSELKIQIQEFYKMDEQHKEIQALLKQQFEYQQQFYERELKHLCDQLGQKEKEQEVQLLQNMANQSNQLNATDQANMMNQILKNETIRLGKLFTSTFIQQKTKSKEMFSLIEFLIQNINAWLEQLRQQLFMIFQTNLIEPKPINQFRIIAKSQNSIQSDCDSVIDVGQLLNINNFDESAEDLLDWESPGQSQSRQPSRQSNQSQHLSKRQQPERFKTDNSELSERTKQLQQNLQKCQQQELTFYYIFSYIQNKENIDNQSLQY